MLSAKQQKALDSKASIVTVGGGNGGGKRHLLRLAPLRPEYLGTAGSRSALFAETNPKLEMADGLVDKCRELYPSVGGEYRASPKKRWTFPTHATVDLSYVGDPDQWDGSQIAFIGIDQAEQIDDTQFWPLQSRNRSSAHVPCQLMATANPPAEGQGALGHPDAGLGRVDRCRRLPGPRDGWEGQVLRSAQRGVRLR